MTRPTHLHPDFPNGSHNIFINSTKERHTMIMRKNTLAVGLIAAIASVPAMASTTNGTLTVKANVIASCSVSTTAGTAGDAVLDFGTISASQLGSNIDASTSTTGGSKLSVTCTKGTSYTVTDGGGTNDSSNQHRMVSGTNNYIAYNLYTTNARTTVFPTTTAAATAYTGNGSTQTYDIFGRIPALSTMPAIGSYTDTVTLTVTY